MRRHQLKNMSNGSSENHFVLSLQKKWLCFMFPPNPISKQEFTSPNHSLKFLCSGAMLSMGGSIAEQCLILQKTWHLRWWSRAAIELLWSSTYWGAFESDSLEWTALCQESHLPNITLLRTLLEAKHTSGQIRRSLPNPTESLFHIEFLFFFILRYEGFYVSVLWIEKLPHPSLKRDEFLETYSTSCESSLCLY